MASETLEFDGKPYTPSKLASKETGYTQDYIGQLARASLILARRVGGLWYINMESLAQHKKNSEAYVPEPPAQQADRSGSIVSFDGKEFITSKRASEMVRYTQDYVGQLARAGKIGSRQVNGRWYVSKDDLRAHKEQKDALLAAVQSDALGIKKPDPVIPMSAPVIEPPLYTYIPNDQVNAPALPIMAEKEPRLPESYVSRNHISELELVTPTPSAGEDDENATHHIAIRAMKRDAEIAEAAAMEQGAIAKEGSSGYSKYKGTWNTSTRRIKPKRSGTWMIWVMIPVIFIALGGYLYASGTFSNIMAQVGSGSGSTSVTSTDAVASTSDTDESVYQRLSDRILTLIGGTLTYVRK
jgi:hypothetical protein